MMSGSLPALPSMPLDQFHAMMETTNPPTMHTASVRRREPGADAMYGPGGCDNIFFSMESQELSSGKRMSEDVARSELEVVERDARDA